MRGLTRARRSMRVGVAREEREEREEREGKERDWSGVDAEMKAPHFPQGLRDLIDEETNVASNLAYALTESDLVRVGQTKLFTDLDQSNATATAAPNAHAHARGQKQKQSQRGRHQQRLQLQQSFLSGLRSHASATSLNDPAILSAMCDSFQQESCLLELDDPDDGSSSTSNSHAHSKQRQQQQQQQPPQQSQSNMDDIFRFFPSQQAVKRGNKKRCWRFSTKAPGALVLAHALCASLRSLSTAGWYIE